MPYVRVKSHYITRNGKRIRVKSHLRKTRGARLKTSRGEKFRKLERKIYAEYRKKGKSKKVAKRIATATAGKVFWRKYGKTRGRKILRREH